MAKAEDWPGISGRMKGKTHILPIRVYYEDTDFGGGVYHSNYLKFCERGRSDFLRLLGFFHKDLSKGDYGGKCLGFAVRHMTCDFLLPARIDDLLEVQTKFVTAKGARLELEQDIFCSDALLFHADVRVVVVDGSGKPARLPVEMSKALQSAS